MGCEQDAGARQGEVARQVTDAVESLVALWFAAVEDVSPRLPARQIRALRIVRRRPELNLTALAEHLEIGLPTASRMCDRLEAAGLLRRTVQPVDRREVQLVVTPHGARFLSEVTDRLSAYLTGALESLSPAQRRALEDILRGFHEAQTLADAQLGRGTRPDD
ncbi:MarR family winged helix-turn-helix transcriptional regulator [Streptomyces poonensis]|uniref:MarR family transcriptional regulator n=1 Tax=Streptomyces poonensis TaxID=68255 RepID=A0A918PD95_9ACTN|nr:MarR family transcriptional regulator [Streptomyces poonensis]GGZ00419.1 MarR family transcriptional regulator [Streptomyces poonensis]GLJ93743.1 MarR family transcriptional regulator [Streptomyces poonensis]